MRAILNPLPVGALLKYLQGRLAARTYRRGSIVLSCRVFPVAGIRYRCADGPWEDSLLGAIQAWRRKEHAK